MKKLGISIALLCFLLSACTSAPTATPVPPTPEPTHSATFTPSPTPSSTPMPTSTRTATPIPTSTVTRTPTPAPITVLDWPFDTSIPIGSVNFFDLDQICMDVNCIWDDNAHFLAYDCVEETWQNTNQQRYMRFHRDTQTANIILHSDGHNGLDLNLPVGTPLVSQWDTTIYTEGDLNVVFLLNDGKLALKLGHISYLPNYARNTHYQVKRGDVVGWVKDGNGFTITHRQTGGRYTEIHFEIMLLKQGRQVTRGRYTTSDYTSVDGLIGACNQNPPIRWRTGLDGLTWVGGLPPEKSRLILTDGANP